MSQIILPIISGVLYFSLFPPVSAGFLAWFFLIPFFFSINGKNKKKRFFSGIFFGFSAYLLNLYWIYPTVKDAGEPFWISAGALILLALILSIYTGIFSFFYRQDSLWVAASGVLIFYLKGKLFSGFPWCDFYISQVNFPFFTQITKILGPHFLNFLIIFVNHSLFLSIKKRNFKIMKVPLFLLFATAVFGVFRLNFAEKLNPMKFTIAQVNVSQSEKWNPFSAEKIFFKIKKAVLNSEKGTLIVFPEAAIPGVLNYDFDEKNLLELFRKTGKSAIVGALYYEKAKLFNTSVFVSSKGIEGIYRKMHLVPFGEYVPLRSVFSFVNVLNEIGDTSPGSKKTIFEFHNAKILNLICNEVIYPDLWHAKSINLIANITNDAWYGKTQAPYQHLLHARFCATATGLPVIFANNCGPSALIDRFGRIVKITQPFKETLLSGKLLLPQKPSFWARNFDLTIIFVLAIFLWKILRGRKCLTTKV